MAAPIRLVGFAVVCAIAFGAAFGLGRSVEPDRSSVPPSTPATITTTTMPGHHDGAGR